MQTNLQNNKHIHKHTDFHINLLALCKSVRKCKSKYKQFYVKSSKEKLNNNNNNNNNMKI